MLHTLNTQCLEDISGGWNFKATQISQIKRGRTELSRQLAILHHMMKLWE